MPRLLLLALVVGVALPAHAAADVRIGVFGLLHPREVVVRSAAGGGLTLHTDAATCARSGRSEARLIAVGGSVRATCGDRVLEARTVLVTSPLGGLTDIDLSVPATIARTFRGRLAVTAAGAELVPVVTMDLETAVASVVAAELPGAVPLEARKAVAVAARSYFVASRGRHRGFDFCDTTHCQFLRDPPASNDLSARAAAETLGLVLVFRGAPVAALYSASCGGRTRSLAEAGLHAGDGYPYFGVECAPCRRDATSWERRLAPDADALQLEAARSEAARLVLGRRGGWSTVPSGNFETSREGDLIVVRGRGAGHGIGLCQLGAARRAEAGESFVEILAAYYPGTMLASVPPG